MWIEVQFLESFHAGTDCSKHSGQDLTIKAKILHAECVTYFMVQI